MKVLYPLLGIYWLAAVLVLLLWRGRLCGDALPPGIAARPVAYSIELELRRRYFVLVFWALVLSFIPTYTLLSYARFRGSGAIWVFAVVGAGLTLLGLVNAYKQLRTIRSLRSERESQLVVAQELSGNASFEHRLLHDVPAENNAWINHVLVGPQGVFAIETRAGPTRLGEAGNGSHAVTVDGRSVRFSTDPDDPDTRSIAEAVGRARWLQTWLDIEARTRAGVQPVLVLPGWRIDITKKDRVTVVNEDGLGALAAGKRVLQPTEIHRIVDALARRNRLCPAIERPHRPRSPMDTAVVP